MGLRELPWYHLMEEDAISLEQLHVVMWPLKKPFGEQETCKPMIVNTSVCVNALFDHNEYLELCNILNHVLNYSTLHTCISQRWHQESHKYSRLCQNTSSSCQ